MDGAIGEAATALANPRPTRRTLAAAKSVGLATRAVDGDATGGESKGRLLATLRERLGARFDAWFADASRVSVSSEGDRSVVIVAGDSPFTLGIVRKQFDADLRDAATHALGDGVVVDYRVVGPSEPKAERSPSAPPPEQTEDAANPAADSQPESSAASDTVGHSSERQPPRAATPGDATLGDWVESAGNAAATRLCRALMVGDFAASPALFWGPSGGGKTHLLQAIAHAARRRRRKVLAIHAEEFLVAFIDSVRSTATSAFRQKHRDVDVLIVDDVQLLIGKQRTLEEFRQTLDALAASGATVVLSADRGPAELHGLGPELASRLAGGVTAEAPWPDATARRRLAVRFAERLGIELSLDAAAALAGTLCGGAREVRGALNRLGLWTRTFAKPIDIATATQVAEELNRLATPPVRLADIQRAVCGVFGVDARTLRSSSRARAVTEPRMLAMWLSRKMTGSPWSEIGDFYGRKSHSTVVAAHKRVESLLKSPESARLSTGDLGETIRRIETALRSA